MNNDLSLSRALGGLRIANPDDATPSPPQPHPTDSELPTPAQPTTDASIPDSQLQTPQSTPQNMESPRTGMEPETSNQATYTQNGTLPYSNMSTRPTSALYNAAPTATVRDQAANSYHILRTDPSRAPAPNESGRPAPEYSPSIPSRESSHRDRLYNQNRQAHPTSGNGPLPPRRSSKGMAAAYAPITGVPVVPEPRGRGPDIPGSTGSEEWKDRGAAVGMRKEVDANGKTIMKPVKKGVRDFSFGRVLGEGSYSSVYLATDRQTLKEYAIKVLEKRHIIKERKIKYVNIEKDTLNRLTEHPGIVRLYYTFQDENSLYYVLDLCSGGELLGVLKKTGTFDVECTRYFGAQILDAIEYMHSRGVIHRDLKPENVLLDDQLHVKITDFGTARLLSDPRAPQAAPRIEDTGTSSRGNEQDDSRAASFVGTAEYVSPELLTNKNACKASDLWAFGCIIYQMLAGRPPFKGGSEYLTFQKIVNLDYDFPPGFPPAARDLVERCLVLDPARRLTIEHIKNHEFFEGQQFGKILWKSKAPRLRPYVPPSQEPKIIQLNGMPSAQQQPNQGARPPTGGNGINGGTRTPGRLITDIPPPSQLDIEWSPVLTKPNERILRLGDFLVMSSSIPNSPYSKGEEGHRKFTRFFGGSTTKKRQRLVMITSSGRIIIAPAGGEEKKVKQDISLLTPDCSWKTQIDAKGQVVWCVDSAGYHWTFEDIKAPSSLDPSGPTPDDWIETLQQAKDIAVSMNMSGSYASDNAFGEISSSMSSPASTFGPEGYNVNDRSHRNPLTRSQASLEDTANTKRNRFSKRQSKQGLGSAF
ncbi:kinase-like domain-containing protein [Xylaria sp. FL1042]|nr:kinase-like domain-containing protein [Xylaria sp. FL1042]